MKTYRSGQNVDYGMYISAWPTDVRFVGAEGEPIEGRDDATYWRVPALLVLPVAPAMGGLFVAAFPTLIFVSAFRAVYHAITDSAEKLAAEHAYIAQSRFQPAAAYLNQPGAEGESTASAPELAGLEAEVKARREDA